MTKKHPLNTHGFNPFCDLMGLNFTVIGSGSSKCSVKVTKQLFNPHGVVHGGVIYSMADTGMGAALYSCLEPGEICATLQVNINYFASVASGTLTCETRLVHKTKKTAVLESEIKHKSSLVAKAVGTYYILGSGRK